MKIEKRNLSYSQIINLYSGYKINGELIGTPSFNKDLGITLAGLEKIVEQYNKRLEILNKESKKETLDKLGVEVPTMITDDSQTSDVEAYYTFNEILNSKINDLKDQVLENVDVLILTEKDIEDQEKEGKKWKESGFKTTPNFWKFLTPVIDFNKEEEAE